MLKSFTRNYEDNSTEAGFTFTFYCDTCSDGYKSSFIQSETYKKGKGIRNLTQGVSLLGRLAGGVIGDIGYSVEHGGNILSESFDGMSPEWQKEHEKAFERAKNEAQSHFHRCHGCHARQGRGLRSTGRAIGARRGRGPRLGRRIDLLGMSAPLGRGHSAFQPPCARVDPVPPPAPVLGSARPAAGQHRHVPAGEAKAHGRA